MTPGYPRIGYRYRARRYPGYECEVVGISEPLRFCGAITDTLILLKDNSDGKSYHCKLSELLQQYSFVAIAAESVPKAPYPVPVPSGIEP